VGAAQASVLAKLAGDRLRGRGGGEWELRGPREAANFLVTQSAVGAANLMFNLVALFALLRIRSGTMNAMAQVGGAQVSRWVDLAQPPDLFVALLVSTAVALPLCYAGAIGLGGLCSRFYLRLPPRALAATVFVALLLLTLLLEGVVGLALCACALSLGIIPPMAGVKRVHLMGAILLPVAVRLMYSA
jgi:putative membrane protein